MPRLVDDGGGHVLGLLKALVEFLGLANFLQQLLRDRFAGLVVHRVVGQHLGPGGPHLVYLRGIFHKIPRHAGTGEARVGYVGKEAMQRVPKLMEQHVHLIQREQRSLALRGLHDVVVIGHDGLPVQKL